MTMPLSDNTVEELLTEATYDQVEIWLILSKIEGVLSGGSEEAAKQTTLQTVGSMLRSGRVDLARHTEKGLVRLINSNAIDELIQMLDSEWKKLGRRPDIGDLPVLVAKEDPTRY
jgi:hypothetical protein